MVSNTSKFKDYIDRVNDVLNKINTDEVENLLSCIKQVVNLRGKIYVLGNGGSAATASHFVNDLNVIAGRRGILIDSISLTDNIASVTAISNDHSFNDIFSVQLTGRLKQSDLVFCISASGNSLNLINAVKLHILTWRISVYLFNTTFRTNVKKTLELLNDYSVIRDNKVSEFRFKDMCDELGQLDSSDYIIKQLKDYEVEFVK